MHLQKILLSVIMLRFHFFTSKQGTWVHKDDRGPWCYLCAICFNADEKVTWYLFCFWTLKAEVLIPMYTHPRYYQNFQNMVKSLKTGLEYIQLLHGIINSAQDRYRTIYDNTICNILHAHNLFCTPLLIISKVKRSSFGQVISMVIRAWICCICWNY